MRVCVYVHVLMSVSTVMFACKMCEVHMYVCTYVLMHK